MKIKLSSAESDVSKLTSRMEVAEQQAESRKLSLDELQTEKEKVGIVFASDIPIVFHLL